MADKNWSIKKLFGSIITRSIVFGTNPIDIERIINKLESVKLINSKVLENIWWNEWNTLAKKYIKIGEEAENKNNTSTAREMYFLASACYYTAFLINYSEISQKKRVYMKFMKTYKYSIQYFNSPIEYIEISYNGKTKIPGYLHLPNGNGSFACVLILTGVGTSKEETHFSARPFVERGIAALTLDIPGIGESLFCQDLKFRMPEIIDTISKSIDYLQLRQDIKNESIGIYGICLGGTIAYKAACIDNRIKYCITAFPLRVDQTDKEKIPAWIKRSKWYEYFSGSMTEDEFLGQLTIREDEIIHCPYFLIHGKHDNWTSLEQIMQLYNRIEVKKESLIIKEEAAITGEYVINHMMPVGEQYHWIKHIVADWANNNLNSRAEQQSSGIL